MPSCHTGGYSVYYLATNATNCNVTAAWRSTRRGDAPTLLTQIHPPDPESDSSSRSSRCVRVAAQRRPHLGAHTATPGRPTYPRGASATLSSASTPPSATWCPAMGSRNAKTMVDTGYGVGPQELVYLDFRAIERLGERHPRALRQPSICTSASPTRTCTRCRCASPGDPLHDGRAVVDYNLMTTVPGLATASQFADQGANRLGPGAHAGPGRRLPSAVHDRRYLSGRSTAGAADDLEFKAAESALPMTSPLAVSQRPKSVDHYHRRAGQDQGTTAVWPATAGSRRRYRDPRLRQSSRDAALTPGRDREPVAREVQRVADSRAGRAHVPRR
jgi:hypothetical protein